MVGTRAFHQALWGTQHVTLMICAVPTPTSSVSLGIFNLMPITEFGDLIPSKYLSNSETDDTKHVQGKHIQISKNFHVVIFALNFYSHYFRFAMDADHDDTIIW